MIRMFSGGHFPITMTFGGYNFVDVRDVAKGTVAAGDLGGAGEVYILCNDSCTVDEFIRLLAEVCGNKPPRIRLGKRIIDFAAPIMEGYYKAAKKPAIFTRYAVRKLCSNCNFSYEHAQKDLGYNPRPLEVSLKETLAWIAENEAAEAEKAAAKAAAEAAAKEAEKQAAAAAKAAEKEDGKKE
jgi:dihydroflavonol-4-reductase